MPNEFNRLLNTLNSYITCCACNKTNEIEINLGCGHTICSDCKIEQKKCPTCYAKLSSARKKLPSVEFIKEIRNEILKISPGLLADECIVPITNTLNSSDKKEIFGDDKMARKRSAKSKSSIIQEPKNDIDDDVILIEKAIDKTKFQKDKKKKIFYGNYPSQKNSEVCGQILNNLGIVGIDKQPQMYDSELGWNGQLNSIVSRLNGDSSIIAVDAERGRASEKSSPSKDNDSMSKRTSTDSSGLSNKRIRLDDKRTKENSSLSSLISPVLSNFGKVLGVIVDETEIVQRYSSAPKEIVATNSREDIKEPPCDKRRNESMRNLLTDSKKSATTNSERKNSMSKLNINKQDLYKERRRESLDDVELRSDIMADMLNNVSNEIVMVGNTLHTFSIANKDDSKSSLSCDLTEMNNIKNKVVEPLSRPAIDKVTLAVKSRLNKRTDKITVSSDVICISDSDDDIETDSYDNLNDNNKLCGNLNTSTVRTTANLCDNITHNDSKARNIPIKDIKDIKIDNSNITFKQSSSRETSKKTSEKDEDESIDFEGFTEENILISTVKLALFKMNCSKYADISSTSTNLYTLDGKQILIQTVTPSERNVGSPYWEIRSSDVAIEISDSEDESPKVLISSGAQTENEIVAVTPSPSTSRIRPVSITKLQGLEKANDKFMKNDILDTSEPLTPFTPNQEEKDNPLSPKLTATPVSRRQLSFMSPLVEKASQQSHKNGEIEEDLKENDKGCNSSSNDDWKMLHYRMYTMPNCTDDSISTTRLTLTTCSLNTKETALVTKLARMTNSHLSKDFTHNTTHLIIGATGRGTLEYYLAIAYRAFIVTMEWVTLCIALNKILPVTGFIPTEDEGPLKCLEPISPPFVGFYICSKISSANNYPIAEITKTLLSLGGAKMLPDIDAFQTLQDSSFPRFFVYNGESQITQSLLDKCASMHIVPVQFVWVYESISAFRALPVMDFLCTVIHSRTLIRDYKIPDQLACSRYPRLEGEFHPQILDERYQRSI